MSKVNINDLTGSGMNEMISYLESEAKDTQGLIGALNSFINDTTSTLRGSAFDAARAKAAAYIPLLNTRKTIANNLKTAISSAQSTMVGFVSPDTELDYSLLGEVTASLNQVSTSMSQIKADYEESEMNIDEDPDYNNLCVAYDILKKQKKKLEQLIPTDDAAFGSVEAMSSSVTSFNQQVSGIQISNITLK